MRNTEKNARRGSVATVRAASGDRTAAPIPSRMRTTATIRSRPRRPRIFARKGRGLYTRWRAPSYPGEEPGQDRILRMQTVLRLIEDNGLGPVDHLVGDLESSMGRKAMHHDRILLRVIDEGGVDLVQAEHLLFFFQAEDGIRDLTVTGVQTCALPIFIRHRVRGISPKKAHGSRNRQATARA